MNQIGPVRSWLRFRPRRGTHDSTRFCAFSNVQVRAAAFGGTRLSKRIRVMSNGRVSRRVMPGAIPDETRFGGDRVVLGRRGSSFCPNF